MELGDLTALELVNLLRQKKTSAVEIMQATYQHIGSVDGRCGALDNGPLTEEDKQKVHAFITLNDDRALEHAKKIDQQLARGEDPGPLAGVPFSVKDIFCVSGTATTAATVSQSALQFMPPPSGHHGFA